MGKQLWLRLSLGLFLFALSNDVLAVVSNDRDLLRRLEPVGEVYVAKEVKSPTTSLPSVPSTPTTAQNTAPASSIPVTPDNPATEMAQIAKEAAATAEEAAKTAELAAKTAEDAIKAAEGMQPAPATTVVQTVVQAAKPSVATAQDTHLATPSEATSAPVARPTSVQTAGQNKLEGQQIYQKTCQICHAAGIAGAPKLGDAAAWEPRIKQGIEVLKEHVLKGFNAMPPKGTCVECSASDIEAAIDYMLLQAGSKLQQQGNQASQSVPSAAKP